MDREPDVDPDSRHVVDFEVVLLFQVELELLNAFMRLHTKSAAELCSKLDAQVHRAASTMLSFLPNHYWCHMSCGKTTKRVHTTLRYWAAACRAPTAAGIASCKCQNMQDH